MSKSKETAGQRFDEGLYCAESVLSSIADHLNIESDLIPNIATGFCSGMSRTCGTCGAVTGGILGLNVAFGRGGATESVEDNYAAVQEFIETFQNEHGSVNCAELLGCDLGTEQGQRLFRMNNLAEKCRQLTEQAAETAIGIIDSQGHS